MLESQGFSCCHSYFINVFKVFWRNMPRRACWIMPFNIEKLNIKRRESRVHDIMKVWPIQLSVYPWKTMFRLQFWTMLNVLSAHGSPPPYFQGRHGRIKLTSYLCHWSLQWQGKQLFFYLNEFCPVAVPTTPRCIPHENLRRSEHHLEEQVNLPL